MLHRIRNAIEDRSKPYMCTAVYTGDDYECPGPQYCEYYHNEDIQNLLYLLETQICHSLSYGLLFNPIMHDICNSYFNEYSNQMLNLYMSVPIEEKRFFSLSFYQKYKRPYKKYYDRFKELETKINDTEGQVLKYVDDAII